MSISRGPVGIFPSEHNGDARPHTLVYLSIQDIDAVAAEFGLPLQRRGDPRSSCDPDGNRLRIGSMQG